MKMMKIISNFYEKYFHNSDFSTEITPCQYVFSIFLLQKCALKYFKYFMKNSQIHLDFENNFHFFAFFENYSENLKKSFIYNLFISKREA